MKLLINDTVVLIDDEDYDKIKDITWYIHCDNRVSCKINGKAQYLHSFILNTNKLIDHIDRNAFNNQKSNLRLATKSQNAMNSKLRVDNTSGIKGVSWKKDKNKWLAYIDFNNKRIFIGYFNNLKDAAKSRIETELKYFKEFANFDLINEICNKYEFDYKNLVIDYKPKTLEELINERER